MKEISPSNLIIKAQKDMGLFVYERGNPYWLFRLYLPKKAFRIDCKVEHKKDCRRLLYVKKIFKGGLND